MRRLSVFLAVSMLSTIAGAGQVAQAAPQTYDIGFFGDVPYGETGRADLPHLLKDINRNRPAFTVHIGDIKGGGERCDDPVYADMKQRLNGLRMPVVYTPGDNEWTDCDRASNGPYDPEERLGHLRQTFYPDDLTLGKRQLRVTRQSPQYPENARWTMGPATFATVHVVGSNNNLVHDPKDGDPVKALAEYTARNQANLAWIGATVAEAKANGSRGVMFFMHANPNFEGTDFPGYPTDGFLDTIAALRAAAAANPELHVVVGHGDTHYFRVDKPLKTGEGDSPVLANFTRVETFGELNSHWVSVRVDPDTPELFAFTPRIVAANVKS